MEFYPGPLVKVMPSSANVGVENVFPNSCNPKSLFACISREINSHENLFSYQHNICKILSHNF